MSSIARAKYGWIGGVERLESYEVGGYHPVMVDEIIHNRYRIVDKLGYGGYSTVWLARDQRLHRYVALKIGTADSKLARHEVATLRVLADATISSFSACDLVPKIHDDFDIIGPNGSHTCYTVDPAQGNLKEAKYSRLFPIAVARALAAKLALAVSLVHSRGFCHGDIRSRNMLVKLPQHMDELSIDQFRASFGPPEMIPIKRADGHVLTPNVPSQACLSIYLGKKAQLFTLADAKGLILSDFGEAFAPAIDTRLGKDSHIPLPSRAPESLFEPDRPLSYPSDIWSLGTAIWEILGMKFIFGESETEDTIVSQQMDVLGSQHFPYRWKQDYDRPEAAEEQDSDKRTPRRPRGDQEAWPPLEQAFEDFVQKDRRERETAGFFGEDETSAILELMRGMLRFKPEERWTCEEVLGSEWMVKWALPEWNSNNG